MVGTDLLRLKHLDQGLLGRACGHGSCHPSWGCPARIDLTHHPRNLLWHMLVQLGSHVLHWRRVATSGIAHGLVLAHGHGSACHYHAPLVDHLARVVSLVAAKLHHWGGHVLYVRVMCDLSWVELGLGLVDLGLGLVDLGPRLGSHYFKLIWVVGGDRILM